MEINALYFVSQGRGSISNDSVVSCLSRQCSKVGSRDSADVVQLDGLQSSAAPHRLPQQSEEPQIPWAREERRHRNLTALTDLTSKHNNSDTDRNSISTAGQATPPHFSFFA